MAISLPSALLCCAEIWTIIWHKPFHNSFYALFVVRASVDLFQTFYNYFFARISNFFPEWFLRLELPNSPFALFMFLGSYTFCFDNLAMVFILLNRYTAIVRPINHEHIWRKWMPLVLLIVYGIPLYSIDLLWVQVQRLADRDDQGRIGSILYIEANNGTTLNTNVGISTLSSSLFLALCLPINAAILWAYRQRRKQQQSASVVGAQGTVSIQNAAAKAKEELIKRRLLLFAVLTFFGHALLSFSQIIMYLAVTTGNVFLISLMMSQFTIIVDFGLIVLPSWLLLWDSPSFRRQFLATFLPNILHRRIYGTPQSYQQQHTNTIVRKIIGVRNMQISSIQNASN